MYHNSDWLLHYMRSLHLAPSNESYYHLMWASNREISQSDNHRSVCDWQKVVLIQVFGTYFFTCRYPY